MIEACGFVGCSKFQPLDTCSDGWPLRRYRFLPSVSPLLFIDTLFLDLLLTNVYVYSHRFIPFIFPFLALPQKA